MSTEQLDTFANMEPISAAPDSSGGAALPSFDSFDNMEPVLPEETPEIQSETEESNPETEQNGKKTEEKPKADQKDQLDEEEDGKKEVEETPKDGEKPDDKADDEAKAPEAPAKPTGKTVRFKNGDDAVDVSQDATVKVKVAGKNEFVPLKEVINAYSGETAYTAKIEQANTKLQEVEARESQYKGEKDALLSDLREVMTRMDDPDKSPMEALNYLLEISGRPVHTFQKRVLEYQLEEVEKLSDMTDAERNHYWQSQELEYLKGNQSARAERDKTEQSQRELTSRISHLQESHGVSREQYTESESELRQKMDEVSPEDVVQYAVYKPLVLESQEFILENFEEDLGDTEIDTLTTETARTMMNHPKLSVEDAVGVAAKSMGYSLEVTEEELESLESKVPSEAKKIEASKYAVKPKEDGYESFDDFEDYN